jgi:hypothetical protein
MQHGKSIIKLSNHFDKLYQSVNPVPVRSYIMELMTGAIDSVRIAKSSEIPVSRVFYPTA